MLRTIALPAAALLGLSLISPTSAGAAAETCQGRPATLVGTTGQTLTGTDAADVVVTNGALRVNALGGDDVICVTGDASAVPERSRTVVVAAGDGDDRVEVTTPGWGSLAQLGSGADTYVGSSGADQDVRTSDAPFVADDAVDTVRVTSGSATIYSGSDARPNSDVIEVETGTVQWTGLMTPEARLTGGPTSTLRTTARSGDATIDARRRTAVTETSSASWSGFGQLEFATFAFKGTVTFRGTDESDWFRVEARDTYDRVVDMGAGRDFYSSDGFGSGASAYDGGPGRDELLLATRRQDVVADLATGRFTAREGRRTVRRTFDGFEKLVLAARKARVEGSPRGEEIIVIACRTDVSAGAGRDVVRLNARLGEWENPVCRNRRSVVDAGPGDDDLIGWKGRDLLIGGPGRDSADGGPGRDTCRAERTVRCEVRR